MPYCAKLNAASLFLLYSSEMYIRQTEATRRSDLLGDQSWARTSESDFSARVDNLVSELLEFKEVRNLSDTLGNYFVATIEHCFSAAIPVLRWCAGI